MLTFVIWFASRGTKSGVLLLKDRRCATPDASPLSWHASPGWKVQPGLRVIAMSEEEADRWEAQSNPWGEMAVVNEALEIMDQAMKLDPISTMRLRSQRKSTVGTYRLRLLSSQGTVRSMKISKLRELKPLGMLLICMVISEVVEFQSELRGLMTHGFK